MTFFRHFPKKSSCISPQKVNYHRKFLEYLFLVMDNFQAFKCSVSPQGGPNPWPTTKGGSKTLHFAKITLLSLFFLPPKGGQTPLPTSMGDLWIRHWGTTSEQEGHLLPWTLYKVYFIKFRYTCHPSFEQLMALKLKRQP